MRPITDASLVIAGKKPRGRPRVADPLDAQVVTWVNHRVYAKICKAAYHENVKVSALVRSLLLTRFP